MADKIYTKDELSDATSDKVDKWLNNQMMVNGKDDGLDGWFTPDETQGFRLAEPNTIQECHGYNFASKEDIVNDIAYINLPQEKKDLIPGDDTLFLLIGKLKTGEVTVTHWLREQCRFAQKVACDWWDNAEADVLEEWGVEYKDIDEN